MSAVKCIECAKWSPKRAAAEWARQGFGHCERRETFIVHGGKALRDCEHHDLAEAGVIQERRDYVVRQKREAVS